MVSYMISLLKLRCCISSIDFIYLYLTKSFEVHASWIFCIQFLTCLILFFFILFLLLVLSTSPLIHWIIRWNNWPIIISVESFITLFLSNFHISGTSLRWYNTDSTSNWKHRQCHSLLSISYWVNWFCINCGGSWRLDFHSPFSFCIQDSGYKSNWIKKRQAWGCWVCSHTSMLLLAFKKELMIPSWKSRKMCTRFVTLWNKWTSILYRWSSSL